MEIYDIFDNRVGVIGYLIVKYLVLMCISALDLFLDLYKFYGIKKYLFHLAGMPIDINKHIIW
jgi:hypothetical protein